MNCLHKYFILLMYSYFLSSHGAFHCRWLHNLGQETQFVLDYSLVNLREIEARQFFNHFPDY